MGLVTDLQRWLAGDADTADDTGGTKTTTDSEAKTTTDSDARTTTDGDAKTTIDDAEATSLRAIKLPDEERDALDADERNS